MNVSTTDKTPSADAALRRNALAASVRANADVTSLPFCAASQLSSAALCGSGRASLTIAELSR